MKNAPRLRVVNLEKTTEVDEPTSYAADLENSAGLQDFDAQLLQETTRLEVQVPRGLRTHGSTAIAGQLRSGSANPVPVPTKVYEVTVEPGANERKPKDFIREYWRPFSEFEFDMLQSREEVPEPTTVLHPRFCFRSERQTSFQATRRFPALVSPRILPAWRRAEPSAGSPLSARKSRENRAGRRTITEAPSISLKSLESPRPATGSSCSSERIHAETASRAVKRKVKRCLPQDPVRWTPAHTAGARLERRAPALFVDEYDAPKKLEREKGSKDRERWMSDDDMLTTSRSRSQSAEDLQFESRLIRHWGRFKNKALEARYQQKLTIYRKESTNMRKSLNFFDTRSDDSDDDRTPVERNETPDAVGFLAKNIKRRFTIVAEEAASTIHAANTLQAFDAPAPRGSFRGGKRPATHHDLQKKIHPALAVPRFGIPGSNSRSASRAGSRMGSRMGSRVGSRCGSPTHVPEFGALSARDPRFDSNGSNENTTHVRWGPVVNDIKPSPPSGKATKMRARFVSQ